ncbi:MAG: D-alanyl-D-alanine carboxypeptidase [Rhodospirillaceae bacterium]|nr:D-alanyl-D-alanine carboxypeptidase [Rhodospirillaceae bacterium]MBT5567105.1 D-alanyl-D-alanine carboxypeptidase [Rhodospirillaceae bacterium]MBT6089319.1 D-alanyl-D-alanine carboxypeptidase [Rhodospirillaceae bacterium]MBT6959548.1 D-alanyl-D-alanine carboxypeptidase [Rhodospirillaceae bacterium]
MAGLLTGLFFSAALSISPALAIEIAAREFILVDFQTGTVLDSQNGSESMPPSSMSKLMTAYMVFEAIHSGALSLDDEFMVSENAWRQGGAASGGSTMFLEPNSRVRVEDLLRGIIIQSGNDACIVVAENMAGSEEAFADEMTERARDLGLTGSNFANSTGLPDPNHYMTAEDLALLARLIVTDFPEYYSLYKETEFTYNEIKQFNRNPLLYRPGGSDGLKTGYTDAAGYGLAASAVRDGRRLILVANGMASTQARSEETAKLMDWGFRNFTNKDLFRAGEMVSDAEVWLGLEATIPLIIEQDITVTIPRQAWRTLEVKAVYDGPIAAPIEQGVSVAKLVINGDGMDALEYDLVAGASVAKLGFTGRIQAAASQIIFGFASGN